MSEMLGKISETVGELCKEYGRQLLELRQERDQLRAELAAAKEECDRQYEYNAGSIAKFAKLEAERNALAADNARLRKALELAKSLRTAAWTGTAHVAAMVGHDIDDCECETCKGSRAELNHISDVMRDALAATPAQALAAHDAALLREVAAKLDGEGRPANEYYRNWLMAEADRIEREESESKNGEENDRQTQDNKCIG